MMIRVAGLIVLGLSLLAGAGAGSASAKEARFACKCKGYPQTFLFWTTYHHCGNGFMGGNNERIRQYLSASDLGNYLPPGVSNGVINGAGCTYYPTSGWNCGKMSGVSLPSCLND